MEEKKFKCKAEDVPVIAGFALKSYEIDIDKFVAFSPIFTPQYKTEMVNKQTECYELTKSTDVLKLQKVLTAMIADKMIDLRLILNPLEGYLKFGEKELDIHLSDFGLRRIRTAISKTNVEGVISETRTLIAVVKRNEVALLAKGMKAELVTSLMNVMNEIDELNTQQNAKKNERSRVADDNTKVFNELWDYVSTIVSAGRAIFRGVDEVKLREYTMSNLLKRVHSENGSTGKAVEIVTETTEVKSA